MPGCTNKYEEKRKKSDWQIPGKSNCLPAEIAAKSEVLIGYSDCYTCQKVEQRSAAPAFKDIAKRYPAINVYIEMPVHKRNNVRQQKLRLPNHDSSSSTFY